MNKKLTLLILFVISSLLFSQDIEIIDAEKIKNMKPRAKKRLLGKNLVIKQDPYNVDEINQLKILYEFGNQSALNVMLNIFSDKNQTYEIRLLCLDLLSSIDSPLVKDALKNSSSTKNPEML